MANTSTSTFPTAMANTSTNTHTNTSTFPTKHQNNQASTSITDTAMGNTGTHTDSGPFRATHTPTTTSPKQGKASPLVCPAGFRTQADAVQVAVHIAKSASWWRYAEAALKPVDPK